MSHLHYLAPFIQVVKCGSFSAAAEQLGLTTSAVSKSISRLEQKLSMRLFNRTTRQVNLTSEGRDFFERISTLVDGIDGAIENAMATMAKPEGTVRVAVGATFGRYCLMPIIADFFIQYPQIKLEIDFDDTPKDSLEHGFDVEIRYGQGKRNSYVSRRLLSELPFILVASPLYLARRGVPLSIEDLSHHDHIRNAPYVKSVEANWKLMRIQDQPITSGKKKKEFASVPQEGRLTVLTQYDTSLIAALNSIGISTALLQAALPFLKAGRLKVVLPDYRIKYISSPDDHSQMYIQYPHREHLPPKVRVFVEYLLERFRSGENASEDISAYAA